MPADHTDAAFVARDRSEGSYDPAWQLVIRAIWCRGERQALAHEHMRQRGLWLTEDQKRASMGRTRTQAP